MSLAGKTVWVVGGVGTVGRGIARGLLQAGATVLVNSSNAARLERITEELDHPSRLVPILGSLRPDFAYETVQGALKNRSIDHVVAHGAVRYWTTDAAGCDEAQAFHPLRSKNPTCILQYSPAEFTASGSALASYHFAAAQMIIPRMVDGTYTFVTGDGCGHPDSRRTPMREVNAHHVRGLASALRRQLKEDPNVSVRELRVGLSIPQFSSSSLFRPAVVSSSEQHPASSSSPPQQEPSKVRPISEEIGDVCAGWIVEASATGGKRNEEENGYDDDDETDGLIKMETEAQLDRLLTRFRAPPDETLPPLPSLCEFTAESTTNTGRFFVL